MSSDISLLHRDPAADRCIDPADLNVPVATAQPAANRQIGVLPAIDLTTGSIGFALPSGWRTYFHPEPAQVAAALREALRPAQWNPFLEVLTITVASAESRAGDARHFSLTGTRER